MPSAAARYGEETPREPADKEEMDIHIPSYPLPQEIQQMDQTEKACRYCGVSYLILHEFQRLQERLQEVERELERARGSVEREKALREELQQAFDHLNEMKRSVLQQEETIRALDLQLCVVRHEMESVRTDKERVCMELENEHARRLHLRWRCEQQQQVLWEALALLKSSRGQMTSIKSRFTHFQENWEDSKALIQQSCISADAECKQKADGMEAELNRLQGEVPNLMTCLDAAQEQILQLDSQVRTQKLLQSENQEAWSLIQGLREEMKTLNEDLQNNKHEREIVKKLLETKSAEKEELQELWSKQTRDQKAGMERLSRDLREKEESRLSCQQRCESLQEQLLAWQQKEEEMTCRLEQAEAELKDLRAARSTLQQERLSFFRKELRRIHSRELERLQESFRTRLEAAEEEHNSKMEAFLEQKQAEQVKQLKQLEMELRRDAVIELDIQRQKNQELLQKYQTENQQLQKKVPAIIHSATQELHEEIAVLRERIKHQGEARESASKREKDVVQREGEAQLQSALQDLQQAQKQLQHLKEEKTALEEERDGVRAALGLCSFGLTVVECSCDVNSPVLCGFVCQVLLQSVSLVEQARLCSGLLHLVASCSSNILNVAKKYLLEETVRRECEEREELTSALTLAREQLLDLKHISTNPRDTQTHTRLSRSTLANPDTPTSQQNPILLHNNPRNHSTPPTQGTRRKSLVFLIKVSHNEALIGLERPLENYVEEIVGVCYRVSWSDQALNLAFVAGLDDILLVLVMLPDADEYRLEDFVNRVLQATGSEFCVGVTDEDLSGGRPVSVTGQGFVPAHLGSTPHSSTTQQREQDGTTSVSFEPGKTLALPKRCWQREPP
ncbi:hypothetical protein E1301_Tti016074 [Triplophysa tibetana]|uniref:Leucine-, glutamate-and lysine-rich protein 1 n=1 Tax=Triplophysa tibetana TaxID=1572043 RepID=A0A5A9NYH9_9TELE|nr:hypothetical protein E1301_Tti016074 [Triplophysa tibetana]